MVSHPTRAAHAHAHSASRASHHSATGPAAAHHKKAASSSSNGRAPSRDGRPAREGTAQRQAQDVAGLKDFQLGELLGKGAHGSVFRALNWGTGETVAIKQVKLETLGQADLKTIMLEIDLLKSLTHPNIVKYKGSVKSAESLYIILEFCENGSLHSVCKKFGKFPEPLVGLFMSQVLQGLLYLHEQGVIHRDIKGANILTTKEGLVKLADFGVATNVKQSGADEAHVVGTPYWMAPEVIEMTGATTASDIWSVGCTIIELIDGKPPYHHLQPMQALFRIVHDDHPPIPGSVSNALRDFLMECFQKNANLRIDARRLLQHKWILSTKRTAPDVAATNPEFNQAVNQIQQYNERLDSEPALRRTSAAAPQPRRVPVNVNLNIPRQRPIAESFRSPDFDKDDNWDDDFDESISPRAFHQPHLKPHDHFGGLFSSDKLKAIASVMDEPSALDGEATVKSPLNLQHLRGLPSVFAPADARRGSSTRTRSTTSRSTSTSTITEEEFPERQEGPPKTAFLRGVPKMLQPPRSQATAMARPAQMFRENTIEDYSDLTVADESAFELKLKAMQIANPPSMFPREPKRIPSPAETFSPKLFHPNDLKTAPKSTRDARANGSRQRTVSSTSRRRMQRSQSEIEMQKYAEDDRDDFSDVFGDIKPGRAESDSGSEHSSMAMITSKMSSSFMMADDDDLDPFANMDEGLENINMENNVARDRDDRLTKQTEMLVGDLKINQPDVDLLKIADQLLEVLYESPEKRSIVLRSHGMLPILEILREIPPNELVLPLLKIINLIIHEDAESQESLSMLGGIPTICTFASKRYPSEIRKEAAAFVRQMYQTSTLTLQIFVGCGGINVLVDFLEEDIDEERDLVLIGVNGVWNVFELQGSAPKNDFCRLLSRSSVLYPLSLVLNRVISERDEVAQLIQGRIVSIFLIFSQAESFVKELVADRMILKRVLRDLYKMLPVHQVTMLKFIKNLSMLSSTHEALQNSNAIDTLIELFRNTQNQSNHREISNQVLNTMYNLCRHNKSRQEEAALSDIIPLLKDVVNGGGPLKEFALPILCELAHSGKVARKMLWDAKGLQFYISMLSDRNWQVTALDAIFVWLAEETARVEQYLLSSNFSSAIITSYTSPELSQSNFENMLEPLQKLVRLSPPIAASLAVREIFTRTVQKLGHKDAVTRLNLLRILDAICYATEDECTLIRQFGVYDTIVHLSEHDHAVLVRQMAGELVRACDSVSKRSTSRASGFRRPASSSGTRAGSGSSTGSTLPSGMTPPTPSSLKAAFSMPHGPTMPPTPTMLGPPRERITRSQSSAGIWDLLEEPGANISPKPMLTRASTTGLNILGGHIPSSPITLSTAAARTPHQSRPPSRDTTSSLSRITSREAAEKDSPSSAKGASRLPKARQNKLSEVVSARRRQSQSQSHSQSSQNQSQNQAHSQPQMHPHSNSQSSTSSTGAQDDTPTPTHTPSTPSTPLPRLQIVRRRRETSGGEMSTFGPTGSAVRPGTSGGTGSSSGAGAGANGGRERERERRGTGDRDRGDRGERGMGDRDRDRGERVDSRWERGDRGERDRGD